MDISDLAKYALIAGVGLGGTFGAWQLALRSGAGKKLQDAADQVTPPDGGPKMYERVEEIFANVVGLTTDVRGVKIQVEALQRDQTEIRAEVRKAVNDRAEIIERLSHMEGQEDARRIQSRDTPASHYRRRKPTRRKSATT